jgi:glyoxylase-like metal-dependent hydrolase (beta-lactamase superfamily II)
MTSVRDIYPLTVGWERLPRSFSLHGDETGERLVEPVPAILLDTDDGWVLLDTGINTALVRDPWLRERLHDRNHEIEPILASEHGEPLEAELGCHGVGLGDISRIHLSHLHNDHAGGLRLFDAAVQVTIQRAELAYGLAEHPHPEQHGMFRIDYDDPLIDWQIIDGDAELAPGIRAVFTPGHTPGHMSFVIDLPAGDGYVFAFDAGDLTENFEQEIPPGGLIHNTPETALESLRRLKVIAAELGYPLIPGHDPVVWPQLTESLAAARRERRAGALRI